MELLKHYHCPGCSRRLERCGAIFVDGEQFPVFQCDDCTKSESIFGERFDIALTFYVNGKGEPVDPAAP